MRLVVGLVGVVTGLVGLCGGAWAEGVLAVAPLRLILSDAKNSDLITLTNRADGVRKYEVVMQDQVMQPDGSLVEKDDFGYSAKRMLRFMPRQVTLKPGERQNIRVMAMMPEGLADGDYHTHIIFEEQKPEMVSGTTPQSGFKVAMGNVYSLGVPLIVQHGKIEAKLELVESKLISKNGRQVVDVMMVRKGNAEASALIQVVNAAGEQVVPMRNMHAYREVDNVTVQLPVKEGMKLEGLKVKLIDDGKVLGELPVN